MRKEALLLLSPQVRAMLVLVYIRVSIHVSIVVSSLVAV